MNTHLGIGNDLSVLIENMAGNRPACCQPKIDIFCCHSHSNVNGCRFVAIIIDSTIELIGISTKSSATCTTVHIYTTWRESGDSVIPVFIGHTPSDTLPAARTQSGIDMYAGNGVPIFVPYKSGDAPPLGKIELNTSSGLTGVDTNGPGLFAIHGATPLVPELSDVVAARQVLCEENPITLRNPLNDKRAVRSGGGAGQVIALKAQLGMNFHADARKRLTGSIGDLACDRPAEDNRKIDVLDDLSGIQIQFVGKMPIGLVVPVHRHVIFTTAPVFTTGAHFVRSRRKPVDGVVPIGIRTGALSILICTGIDVCIRHRTGVVGNSPRYGPSLIQHHIDASCRIALRHAHSCRLMTVDHATIPLGGIVRR